MAQPVVHFEIIGGDAAHQQRYYRELFGWEITPGGPGGYGLVAATGPGIGGGIGAGVTENAGHVTVYVGVPDVEAALSRAEDLGGKRVFGPDKVPGADVELGQFTDPAGHLIGVTKLV